MSLSISHSININASPDKVWAVLTDHSLIPKWSACLFKSGVLTESSGDFIEGGVVYFDDEEMEVTAVKEGAHLHLNHKSKKFAPGREHYNLKNVSDGKATILRVDVDVSNSLKDFFNDAWPKALSKLKKLAEDIQ